MKFLATVDTEADNQWKSGGRAILSNIEALPRFQHLCEEFGYTPTYFITYEVANSDQAMNTLLPLERGGRAEIGTHLHPWTNPPHFNEEEEHRLMHFPCELADDMLRAKFIVLHERIEERLGHAPSAFRAGRWGVDRRVEALLQEFGYEADCSVTPYVDWKKTVRGGETRALPNFRNASLAPGMLTRSLVEIPMTIVPKSWEFLSTLGANVLGRGSMAVTWCRIFPETAIHELIDVYYEVERRKLPFIQFMVHSSEFIRGGSPYTKTEEALEHLFTTMEEFFDFLRSKGVDGITATQAAKEFKRHL